LRPLKMAMAVRCTSSGVLRLLGWPRFQEMGRRTGLGLERTPDLTFAETRDRTGAARRYPLVVDADRMRRKFGDVSLP
jgi:hypothetical protein